MEDDVLITADGCENLTLCPRAVQEVLDVMKGGAWPRKSHLASRISSNMCFVKGNDDSKSYVQLLSESISNGNLC